MALTLNLAYLFIAGTNQRVLPKERKHICQKIHSDLHTNCVSQQCNQRWKNFLSLQFIHLEVRIHNTCHEC